MSKSLKATVPIVVLAFISCTYSFVLFARYDRKPNVSVMSPPNREAARLTGTYEGAMYLRNIRNTAYLIAGDATLIIYEDDNKTKFQLLRKKRKTLTGEINAWTDPEKGDLKAGEVILDNQKPIEIRWKRDWDRDTLRIEHAQGAKRKFLFCYPKPAKCVFSPGKAG